MRTFVITFFAVAIVAAFLSPLIRAVTISVKTSGQISQTNSPIYPADPETFIYKGHAYDIYKVPINGTTRELALVTKGKTKRWKGAPYRRSDVKKAIVTLAPGHKIELVEGA